MFFKKELLALRIFDVLKFSQRNTTTNTAARSFNALSFRIRANTKITTEKQEYFMTDNMVAYIPARLCYVREAAEDEMIVVHFDSLDYRADEIEYFISSNPEIMKSLFEKIFDEWNEKVVGYKYRCTAIFYEILRECYSQNFALDEKTSKIQNSVDYLLKNFKDPEITIGDIAKQSFVSEVYFRKIFKKEYGISPQKYIVSLRIQNAKSLIDAGYFSLQEVAYLSGYSDYKYFSVEFKRVVGVSPSEYNCNR